VLLAEEEHAHLGAVTVRADAVQVLLERTTRDARGGVEEVRQVRARAGLDDAGAPVAAEGRRLHERGGRRIGVDGVDDVLGRRVERAGRVGAEDDLDQLVGDRDAQRLVGMTRPIL
jgi:hypothetical protein